MIWWIWVLISALLASSTMITEKKALFKEHALEFCTVIFIIGAAIMFIFIDKVEFDIPLWLIGVLYIVAWVEVIAYWMYAKSLRHVDISLIAPLLSFGPVVVVVLAFLSLGEVLKIHNVVGVGLIVLGSYVLQLDHKHVDVLNPFKKIIKSKHLKYILIAIFLWAFLALFTRYILDVNNPISINIYTKLFYGFLFGAINFLILLTIFYDGYKGVISGVKKHLPLVFLGAIFMISSGLIYGKIVSKVMVSLVYPVYKINTLFATLFGGELFHEKHLVARVLASIIMVIGIYFVVV